MDLFIYIQQKLENNFAREKRTRVALAGADYVEPSSNGEKCGKSVSSRVVGPYLETCFVT